MTNSNENPGSTGTGSTMAWGTTSFEPGDHVGLVARRTIALIAGDNPSTRERLWALVSADTPIDDILEELSSTGIKSLPDFGVVQVEGDGVRVVARGAASVSIELSSGDDHEIDATDVHTWVEDHIDDVLSVTVSIDGEGDAGDSGFAVLAGSVPASMLTRRFDEPDAHAVEGERWSAAPVAARSGAGSAAVAADPVITASEPTPVVDDTDQAEPSLEAAPEVELEPVDDISGAGEMTSVEPSTGAMAAIETDHIAHDDESEAAHGTENEPEAEIEAEPEIETAAAGEDVLDVPSFVAGAAPAALAGDTAGLWGDSAPTPGDDGGAADSSAAHQQPPPPSPGAAPSSDAPAPIFDAAGEVVTDASIDDVSNAASLDVADGADEAAVPFDAAADLESSLIDDDAPLERPSAFGSADVEHVAITAVLAFSNGERIDVDRSVLVGRNPKVTGAIEGPLPYIMKYEGPGQGLSRTHAEIRVEDGNLVIEDLRSTNGTDVQPPGEARRRLAGGEPLVIVPGTLIDFGDELRCMVESPA